MSGKKQQVPMQPVQVAGQIFYPVNRRLARMLGYGGTQAIARLAREGKIPGAYKNGTTWRVPQQWVNRHLNPGRGRPPKGVNSVRLLRAMREVAHAGEVFELAAVVELLVAKAGRPVKPDDVSGLLGGLLVAGKIEAIGDDGEPVPMAEIDGETVHRFRLVPNPVEASES